jgi:hypothetical protein
MKGKCAILAIIVFAFFGLTAVTFIGIYTYRKMHHSDSPAFAALGVPINIEPLPSGADPKDPRLFDTLKDTGIFSYYTDPVNGTKIPLEGYDVELTGNVSGAPVSIDHMDITLWRTVSPGGQVEIVGSLDAENQYSSKERVVVQVSGQFRRITPQYTWRVNPEYQRSPPGVLQDLYVVDAANVSIDRVQTFVANAKGQMMKVSASSALADEVAARFMQKYKKAVFGSWQSTIGDVISRRQAVLPFTAGAKTLVDLPPNSALQFEVLKTSRDLLSFRFGASQFDDVSVGDYRLINKSIAVQIVGTISQPSGEQQLVVVVHFLAEKASRVGVNICFKEPSGSDEAFLRDARGRLPYIVESVVQLVEIEPASRTAIKYRVRMMYTVRALRDLKGYRFEETFNGNYEGYERWPGSDNETDMGNTGGKFFVTLNLKDGERHTIVTGCHWIFQNHGTGRRTPEGEDLPAKQDYISYPNTEDYILNARLVVSSSLLRPLRNLAKDAKGSTRVSESVVVENSKAKGLRALPGESATSTTSLSAEWRFVRPGERLTLYYRWD